MLPTKILVLKDGDVHPTIETAVCFENFGTELVTMSGLRFDTDNVLTVGSIIDNTQYRISSIDVNTIDLIDLDNGNLYNVALEDIEWQDDWQEYHVHLSDDDIDEYTSGYSDAIRDCVKYLLDSSTSTIRKTLTKMGVYYLSDIDTDEKIAEFVSKRLEKKPQLTLDELKEIVGYDFDLV